MTISELIEISKTLVFTDEDKKMLTKRLQKLDEERCRQSELMRPTVEFLNRLYTL